jgi:hypothetical protein
MADNTQQNIVLTVSVEAQDAIKEIAAAQTAIKNLRAENKELGKSYNENSTQIEINKAKIKELASEINTNQKLILSELTTVDNSAGAYAKLSLQYKIAVEKAKDLTVAYGANSAQAKAAGAEASNLATKIKAVDASFEKNKSTVNDYTIVTTKLPGIFGEIQSTAQGAFDAVASKFNEINASILAYSTALEAKKSAEIVAKEASLAAAAAEAELNAAVAAGTVTAEMETAAEVARKEATVATTVATEAGAESMKLLKIAIASTGVGVLVVLLGSLVAWMSQTSTGGKVLTQITAGFGAVMKELTGVVSKAVQSVINFAGGIKSFPDLLSKVGTAIKENIISRLEAFSVLGKSIVKILSGDLKDGFKELGNGVIQLNTGVKDGIDKITEFGKKIGGEIVDAASAGAKIADMENKLSEAKVKSIRILAELDAATQKYNQRLENATNKSDLEDQKAAVGELEKIEKRKMAIQLNLLNQQVAIDKKKYQLAKNASGDAKKNAGSEYEAWQNSLASVTKLKSDYYVKQNEINQKKQNVDNLILLKGLTDLSNATEKEKSIYENQLKNTNASVASKENALKSLIQIQDKLYASQLAYLNNLAGKTIDVDKIVKESDKTKVQAFINETNLNGKALTALQYIVNSRKAILADGAKYEADLSKEKKQQLVSDLKYKQDTENADAEISRAEAVANAELTAKQLHDIEIKRIQNAAELKKAEWDAKLAEDKSNQEEIEKQKKLIDKQTQATLAVSNANFNKSEADEALSQKKRLNENLLSLTQKNSKAEVKLKIAMLEAQKEEEIKAAKGNAELIASINAKYAAEEAQFKIDQVKGWADKASELASQVNSVMKAMGDAEVQKAEEDNAAKKTVLDNQLSSGLITKKQYDKEVAKSEADLAAKKKKIAQDDAKREKALNIMKIAINVAESIAEITARAAASFAIPFVGPAMSAATLAQIPIVLAGAAVQTALVAATPLPKASRGMFLRGRSHAAGGIPIEAEGGEAIINKRSTAMYAPLLSAINEAGGGVKFAGGGIVRRMFADGGVTNTAFSNDGGYSARAQAITASDMHDAMAAAVSKVKVYTTVEDYRKADVNYANIVSSGNV